MREITLREFVDETSQTVAGKALGMTQGAIWQALRDEREIYIVLDGGVVIDSYQKKPVGNINSAA